MIANIETNLLLPAAVPTWAACLLALVALGAWAASHLLKRYFPTRIGRVVLFVVRVAVGTAALLAVAAAMQRGLTLATNWPLWPIALLGAGGAEGVFSLYKLERRGVSRRTGVLMAALRAALVLLAVGMLTQPTKTIESGVALRPIIAVLVDDSASMHIADTALGGAEKVRLAELFGAIGDDRPVRLDETARAVLRLQKRLADNAEWLAGLRDADAESRKGQLDRRRKDLREFAEDAVAQLTAAMETVSRALKPDAPKADNGTAVKLQDVRGKLGAHGVDRLNEAVSLLKQRDAAQLAGELDRLVDSLRRAAAVCAVAGPELDALGQALDGRYYEQLPAERRKRVDELAARTRTEIARAALRGKDDADAAAQWGLLRRLRENYEVRAYSFASQPSELDLRQWMDAAPTPQPAGEARPAAQLTTDLAAALKKVMTDVPPEQLAGVVLVTDGRHNASEPVEPLARQLGLRNVSISAVVLGAARAPLDAAVVAVDAPDTVFTQDQLVVAADLKLDGLAGREVSVALKDGDKTVASTKLRIPNDAFRTRVELSDTPQQTGMKEYRVVVDKFDGEVFATNNEYPVAVRVTDDRIKVLLVGGHPSWEFRYLRNLFASRDRTVQLQYYLADPDRIEGEPARRFEPASVSRPREQPEASALPGAVTPEMPPEAATAEIVSQWLKFDVVILGDIDPKVLRPADYGAIRKLVMDRGGTLVVIAGAHHMPHAYSDTPLDELLPVSYAPSMGAVTVSPEPRFRIALTGEGRDSVLMRLDSREQVNQELWNSFPEIAWRHPIQSAKPGATVLAYALPPSPPEFVTLAESGQALSEQALRDRETFQREHALIVSQNVALGRVLFLAFDRTWRLRYLAGDTYHHRFWGQVLRWATGNRLAGPNEFVRFGTDRVRYASGASVEVRARLLRNDYSTFQADDVYATVYSGPRAVLRKKLEPVPDQPGTYGAELGALPAGTYRAELESPTVQAELLGPAGVDKVTAPFSVDRPGVLEETELSADRGLLGQLASLTGGTLAEPLQAAQIADRLGKRELIRPEGRELRIWNSWALLAAMVALAAGEWVLRKKEGLV